MAERPLRGMLDANRDKSADATDFFPTPPWAGRALAELVQRYDPAARRIWEPACGAGHLVHALRDYFPLVLASDAYPYDGNPIFDFLTPGPAGSADWIVTNPPFANIGDFIRLAYARARRGVALLMRAAALESCGRYELHTDECPLTVFAPFSERVPMHKARWEPDGTTAAFYAVFLWLKPVLRPQRFMARGPDGLWKAATDIIPPGQEDRLTRPDDLALFGARQRGAA